ncbi:MAG: hypothetical protein Q4Q17_01260 [Tissierellia bacterium]|nr:hypothetical protein [Tissierellia bacterium]
MKEENKVYVQDENGKEYEIVKNPFITGTFDKPYYEGVVRDAEGELYIAEWQIKAEYNAEEMPEEEACDWDVAHIYIPNYDIYL